MYGLGSFYPQEIISLWSSALPARGFGSLVISIRLDKLSDCGVLFFGRVHAIVCCQDNLMKKFKSMGSRSNRDNIELPFYHC